MKIKFILLPLILVLLIPSKSILPQNEPKPPEPPELEVEPVFEEFQELAKKNEDKILKALPSDVKEDLLKVKALDEEEYYDLLSESSNMWFESDWEFFLDPLEKKRFEQSQKIDQIEMQTGALGFLHQNSKSNEQQKIKTKLRGKLEQLFDLKELERRLEIEMLEYELQELKTSLDARKNNKNEIINRRLNELIGMDDFLEWD